MSFGKYDNAYFYDAAGKFIPEKAKTAYFEMMEAHGYKVAPILKTPEFWVTDFGLGDFAHVGMGGIFWCNEIAEGYFAHEIYLLPNQMIAEHAHASTQLARAKMESWHVRYGEAFMFGEEGVPPPSSFQIPESQKTTVISRVGHHTKLGEVYRLNRVSAYHFMMAGAEGVIVTEYGTPQDGAAVRFTNPGVSF